METHPVTLAGSHQVMSLGFSSHLELCTTSTTGVQQHSAHCCLLHAKCCSGGQSHECSVVSTLAPLQVTSCCTLRLDAMQGQCRCVLHGHTMQCCMSCWCLVRSHHAQMAPAALPPMIRVGLCFSVLGWTKMTPHSCGQSKVPNLLLVLSS